MASNIKRVSLVSLAIAEMVAFTIAAGTVRSFIDQLDRYIIEKSKEAHINVDVQDIFDSGIYGREEFFLFALGTGFFVAVFSVIITIAGRQDTVHFAASMASLHAYSALVLLVSASLLAKTSMKYESKNVCELLNTAPQTSGCYQFTIGVIFGFVSMALLIGDTIIHICSLTQNAGTSFVHMKNMLS